MSDNWIKKDKSNKIYWLDNGDTSKGEFIFSFDKKTRFNLFADYPYKLTQEQIEIFNDENPFWFSFFINRFYEDL